MITKRKTKGTKCFTVVIVILFVHLSAGFSFFPSRFKKSLSMCKPKSKTELFFLNTNSKKDTSQKVFEKSSETRSNLETSSFKLDSLLLTKRGPSTPAPIEDYELLTLFDKILMTMFGEKLGSELGRQTAGISDKDTKVKTSSSSVSIPNEVVSSRDIENFSEIIQMIKDMHNKYDNKRDVHEKSRKVLNNLFPPYLPFAFKYMFALPFPSFSAQMNCYITKLCTFWLMGKSVIGDIDFKDESFIDPSNNVLYGDEAKASGEFHSLSSIGRFHGLKVERCRYLEDAGCASICIHTCKIPTQLFFNKDMGIPLKMVPNYDDFSCEFKFGVSPSEYELEQGQIDPNEIDLITPCFGQCQTTKRRTPPHQKQQICEYLVK